MVAGLLSSISSLGARSEGARGPSGKMVHELRLLLPEVEALLFCPGREKSAIIFLSAMIAVTAAGKISRTQIAKEVVGFHNGELVYRLLFSQHPLASWQSFVLHH